MGGSLVLERRGDQLLPQAEPVDIGKEGEDAKKEDPKSDATPAGSVEMPTIPIKGGGKEPSSQNTQRNMTHCCHFRPPLLSQILARGSKKSRQSKNRQKKRENKRIGDLQEAEKIRKAKDNTGLEGAQGAKEGGFWESSLAWSEFVVRWADETGWKESVTADEGQRRVVDGVGGKGQSVLVNGHPEEVEPELVGLVGKGQRRTRGQKRESQEAKGAGHNKEVE